MNNYYSLWNRPTNTCAAEIFDWNVTQYMFWLIFPLVIDYKFKIYGLQVFTHIYSFWTFLTNVDNELICRSLTSLTSSTRKP